MPTKVPTNLKAARDVHAAARAVISALRAVFILDPVPHLMRQYVARRDRRSGRFLELQERDGVLVAAGVPAAPRRFEGTLGSLVAAERLLGSSAFGSTRAEGIVIRPVRPGDGPRVAKVVDRAWGRKGDAEWSDAPEENIVVTGAG